MTLLDSYSVSCKISEDLWKKCFRVAGPFSLGPTKRGGFFLRCGDKDIKQDMSLKELKELRDLINDFLTSVAGE